MSAVLFRQIVLLSLVARAPRQGVSLARRPTDHYPWLRSVLGLQQFEFRVNPLVILPKFLGSSQCLAVRFLPRVRNLTMKLLSRNLALYVAVIAGLAVGIVEQPVQRPE